MHLSFDMWETQQSSMVHHNQRSNGQNVRDISSLSVGYSKNKSSSPHSQTYLLLECTKEDNARIYSRLFFALWFIILMAVLLAFLLHQFPLCVCVLTLPLLACRHLLFLIFLCTLLSYPLKHPINKYGQMSIWTESFSRLEACLPAFFGEQPSQIHISLEGHCVPREESTTYTRLSRLWSSQ